MLRYLLVTAACILFAASSQAETVVVNVRHAFLRVAPSHKSADVGSVKIGDKAEVLYKSNKWAKVRMADGRSGYIWHRLLDPVKEIPQQSNIDNSTNPLAKNVGAAGEKEKMAPSVPIIAPASTKAAPPVSALNIPSPIPAVKAVMPSQAPAVPAVAVAPAVVITPPSERCESTQDLAVIIKKDEQISKLQHEVSKMAQEQDALRAQIRQYKLAEVADKNGEKVFLKGVGEVEMVSGAGITTIKVPRVFESQADRVFAVANPQKLVRGDSIYYSAPSNAFN